MNLEFTLTPFPLYPRRILIARVAHPTQDHARTLFVLPTSSPLRLTRRLVRSQSAVVGRAIVAVTAQRQRTLKYTQRRSSKQYSLLIQLIITVKCGFHS